MSTRPAYPESHVAESLKLTADAQVSLFEIKLIAAPGQPIVRLTETKSLTWQGQYYEGTALRFTGESRSADEQRTRPRMTVLDQAAILLEYAFIGYLDYAQVTRRLVLRQHLDANVNLAITQTWYVSRIIEAITGQSLSVEMRSYSDGPSYQIPARSYTPPDFPFVSM
jgi:phage-related protein